MRRIIRQPWRHDIQRRRRDREPGVLIGVRKISRYLQVGMTTFYKLYQHGLPAMRLPGGRWCTSKALVDDWIVQRWKAQRAVGAQKAEAASNAN